jgi:RNA polymerase sigma-70 factor, ECF subfamily
MSWYHPGCFSFVNSSFTRIKAAKAKPFFLTELERWIDERDHLITCYYVYLYFRDSLDMNEADLIRLLREGNESAFSELLSVHRTRVINTCYKFLMDRDDAEDISQEVFIEVFQSLKSFRGDAKLSTWIYRIAVTKCLDELKKRKRKKRLTSLGKLLQLDSVAFWLAGGRQPDEGLHEKENLAEITQALNTLPDNQRAAFTLSKIEGYTNPEIAEILGTSVMAVESLVSRAKKKVAGELRKILKKD